MHGVYGGGEGDGDDGDGDGGTGLSGGSTGDGGGVGGGGEAKALQPTQLLFKLTGWPFGEQSANCDCSECTASTHSQRRLTSSLVTFSLGFAIVSYHICTQDVVIGAVKTASSSLVQ